MTPPLSHRFRAVWQPGSYDGDERDLMPEGGRGQGGDPGTRPGGWGVPPPPVNTPLKNGARSVPGCTSFTSLTSGER